MKEHPADRLHHSPGQTSQHSSGRAPGHAGQQCREQHASGIHWECRSSALQESQRHAHLPPKADRWQNGQSKWTVADKLSMYVVGCRQAESGNMPNRPNRQVDNEANRTNMFALVQLLFATAPGAIRVRSTQYPSTPGSCCSYKMNQTDGASAISSVWQEARTPDGRPYYYNVQTKATQWTKPVDLMTPTEVRVLIFPYVYGGFG